MAFKINKDKCVGCGQCEGACPMQCIKIEDGKAEIDENSCIECGACAANCPVEAPEN